MRLRRHRRRIWIAMLAVPLALAGCEADPEPVGGGGAGQPGVATGGERGGDGDGRGTGGTATAQATGGTSVTTAAVDAYDAALSRGLGHTERLSVYENRWPAVTRAVARAGVDHDGAFYAGRGYWHTGFLRGGRWSWEQAGDLDEPVTIDGRGTVLIRGDCNADLSITGDAVVHIYGDLSATITLQGAGEVVIAGAVHPSAAIAASGTLDLYTGGGVSGRVMVAGSGVLVIDGPLLGNLTAGQPATTLHVTGDCLGSVQAPADAASLLTLRVDGFMPTAALRATLDTGFTRVTASLARSDADAGFYPAEPDRGDYPGARWVVHGRASR